MAIPFIPIELDKPRRLRFGLGAMVEFEQLTGIKLASIGDEMSFEVCAKLLWIMLKQDEPELTLEQIYKLVDEHSNSVAEVISLVTEAVTAAMGNAPKNVGKPKA